MEINISNPIAQTTNLLLKIDEKVTSKEEFADESESDNEDCYYEVDISKVEKNEMDINKGEIRIEIEMERNKGIGAMKYINFHLQLSLAIAEVRIITDLSITQ